MLLLKHVAWLSYFMTNSQLTLQTDTPVSYGLNSTLVKEDGQWNIDDDSMKAYATEYITYYRNYID